MRRICTINTKGTVKDNCGVMTASPRKRVRAFAITLAITLSVAVASFNLSHFIAVPDQPKAACSTSQFASYALVHPGNNATYFSSRWFTETRKGWLGNDTNCMHSASPARRALRWRPNCTAQVFHAVDWSVPCYGQEEEWKVGDPRESPPSLVNYGETIKEYLGINMPYGLVPDNARFFPDEASAIRCQNARFTVFSTAANVMYQHADMIIVTYPFPMGKYGRRMLPELNASQSAVLEFGGESIEWYPFVGTKEFQSYFNISIGSPRHAFDYPGINPWLQSPELLMKSERFMQGLKDVVFRANSSVAMMVSNCDQNTKRRTDYLAELMDYIQVDSFGRCLPTAQVPLELLLKHGATGANHHKTDYKAVKHDVFKAYPFVLTFENSNCYDYVTEKAFDALLAGAVPIYMGAPNIVDFLPPSSFIDATWFSGPQQLADYIRHLLSHPAEYEKYHAWRSGDASTWSWMRSAHGGITVCEALENAYSIACPEQH
jgi:hypothetical protein